MNIITLKAILVAPKTKMITWHRDILLRYSIQWYRNDVLFKMLKSMYLCLRFSKYIGSKYNNIEAMRNLISVPVQIINAKLEPGLQAWCF